MFKIGHFSKLANTSVRMLRHYDQLGLLIPETTDSDSAYRYYSAKQLTVVNKIKQLQELGFSLSIIKEMLTETSQEEIETYFEIRQKEVAEELASLKIQQNLVKTATTIIQTQPELSPYHVRQKTIPERQVISLRKKISDYYQEGDLWQQLFQEVEKQHVKISTPPLGLTIYHDDEFLEENMEIEVQSSVIGIYQDTPSVSFKTAPPIEVASVTFSGSYEQMPQIAQVIASWLENNQYQMTGPMLNIFHVSPSQTPNPKEWVTEACYQITKINVHGKED